MLKVVYFIALPLIGLSVGLVAAIGAVLVTRLGMMLDLPSRQETTDFIGFMSRLTILDLSNKQETIAFVGFITLGGLFGLVDSANRFVAWLRMRNGNDGSN
jgi:hypothetical protein